MTEDPLDAIWADLPPLIDRVTLARVIGLKRHDLHKSEARGCIEAREPARGAR